MKSLNHTNHTQKQKQTNSATDFLVEALPIIGSLYAFFSPNSIASQLKKSQKESELSINRTEKLIKSINETIENTKARVKEADISLEKSQKFIDETQDFINHRKN